MSAGVVTLKPFLTASCQRFPPISVQPNIPSVATNPRECCSSANFLEAGSAEVGVLCPPQRLVNWPPVRNVPSTAF